MVSMYIGMSTPIDSHRNLYHSGVCQLLTTSLAKCPRYESNTGVPVSNCPQHLAAFSCAWLKHDIFLTVQINHICWPRVHWNIVSCCQGSSQLYYAFDSLLRSPSGVFVHHEQWSSSYSNLRMKLSECIGSRRGAVDHMIHDQLPKLVGHCV
jgi:hypothetical protein